MITLMPYTLIGWTLLAVLAAIAATAVPRLHPWRRHVCRIALWSTVGLWIANVLFGALVFAAVVPRMPAAIAVPLRIVASAAVVLGYAPLCVAGLVLGGAFGLRLARRAAAPA